LTKAPQPIRSYQRIFRPERRIYQLEGHPLPVPGGVPLRWLAYAAGSVATVLLLGSGSPTVLLVVASLGAISGTALGGAAAAFGAAAGALAVAWIAGGLLGLLDWPLRLVVLPFALATLATQATPDGRGADRFACSWVALRLAPGRRSLGRALPRPGSLWAPGAALWVGVDAGAPWLRSARIKGSGTITFTDPVLVRRAGRRGERLRVRAAAGRRARNAERPAGRLALGAGNVVEVRG
jgi:hypothetical protein